MEQLPVSLFGFVIEKKEKEGGEVNKKFVEDLMIVIYQNQGIIDYGIHGTNPVKYVPENI